MAEATLGTLGRYTLLAEIGRGGFGVVYRAHDTVLNREVALKVLHSQLTVDPDFIGRFRREAQTASALDHRSIIPIYDFGEADGRFFMAMRSVPGHQSLADLIARDGPLTLERTVVILTQVAEALDFAHAKGVLHRDIKSANVLVETDDKVTLTDFGLARAAEGGGTSYRSTGGMIGTPEYMAPEQLDTDFKESIDARADLYSLGIIAFEMLTGRVPYEGNTPAVVAAHLIKRVPDVREYRRVLPAGVADAVKKALAKRREERYVTAITLVAALSPAGRSNRMSITGADSQSAAYTSQRKKQKQWLSKVVLAAVAFAGLGLAAWGSMILSGVDDSLDQTRTAIAFAPTNTLARLPEEVVAPTGVSTSSSAPTGSPVAPTDTLLQTLRPAATLTHTSAATITLIASRIATTRPTRQITPSIAASVAAPPSPAANTSTGPSVVFSEIHCCSPSGTAPLVDNMALSRDAVLTYQISCPGCGGAPGGFCPHPYYAQSINGHPWTNASPGLVIHTPAESYFVQSSSVEWSASGMGYTLLCGIKPTSVVVEVGRFPQLSGNFTIQASAQLTLINDEYFKVYPNVGGYQSWFSSSRAYSFATTSSP